MLITQIRPKVAYIITVRAKDVNRTVSDNVPMRWFIPAANDSGSLAVAGLTDGYIEVPVQTKSAVAGAINGAISYTVKDELRPEPVVLGHIGWSDEIGPTVATTAIPLSRFVATAMLIVADVEDGKLAKTLPAALAALSYADFADDVLQRVGVLPGRQVTI